MLTPYCIQADVTLMNLYFIKFAKITGILANVINIIMHPGHNLFHAFINKLYLSRRLGNSITNWTFVWMVMKEKLK